MGRNGRRAGKTYRMSAIRIPGPGTNVAVCREARGLSQVALARRAGVSVSLLSKIEIGDRALTQGIAASLAQAMGLTLDELLGTKPVAKTAKRAWPPSTTPSDASPSRTPRHRIHHCATGLL
ncbi:helix-turn-helix domain-containing protein [Streptomyces shenzhenensis]|uniref:helix-turn-helix domain-containing protein n=1 Tax=Streptomyces shenzhenensis TaxID=943815 RepID=UPI002867B0AC|nr:helix-turn-helix transcriptional regulator [Streptomyces shenzhenensis]